MSNVQHEREFPFELIQRNSDVLFLFVKNSEEFGSFISHAVGTFLSLIGSIFLLLSQNGNIFNQILVGIYGFSTTFLFLSSTVYHATAESEDAVTKWRKMDHIAIYVMIAGTFTPICFLYLDGVFLWTIIILQWSCVLLGVWIKVFRFGISKKLNVAIYLIQGWMAIIPVFKFWNQMLLLPFCLLAIGGILYTIGAIIYQVGKPNPIPGILGAHEIFHILILFAAICHFLVIKMIF